jgi:hypothetical protein
MSRLSASPVVGIGGSCLSLLILASQMEMVGQPEQAAEHAFMQLVHQPTIVQPAVVTPSISNVALSQTPPETLFDSYDFHSAPLRTGSVRAYAIRGELPSGDWEY